jgi:uncharacterized phage-associated protein
VSVKAASAAKYLCGLSNWRLSNLELQKMLYIAHMVFLGQNNGAPLVDEVFEAWDYGPVIPELYHQVKMFGNAPVKDVFYSANPIDDRPEAALLKDAWQALAPKRAGELVAITHWDHGAWAKHYNKGLRGRRIPNEDILAEYRARMAQPRTPS